jgi:hypothetical protein
LPVLRAHLHSHRDNRRDKAVNNKVSGDKDREDAVASVARLRLLVRRLVFRTAV